MESPIPNLSQIYDEILAEEHDVVEAVSERISAEGEREDMEEVTRQDVREQGEGGTASANGAWERQGSEPEVKRNRKSRT